MSQLFPETGDVIPDLLFRSCRRSRRRGKRLLFRSAWSRLSLRLNRLRLLNGSESPLPGFFHHRQHPAERVVHSLPGHQILQGKQDLLCLLFRKGLKLANQHRLVFLRHHSFQRIRQHNRIVHVRFFIHTVCETTYVMVRFPNSVAIP